MLRIHTIFEKNLERAAEKYNWTDHAVNTIKKIIKAWLNSNIAKSILLFFKENSSWDLHSYMPIVSEINENTPNSEDIKGPRGQAQIIGVRPYENIFETSSRSSQFREDAIFVTSIMRKKYWNGNEVFKLMKAGMAPFARERMAMGIITEERKQPRRLKNRLRRKTRARKTVVMGITDKKEGTKKKTEKKTGVTGITAKKAGAKKKITKKTTTKKRTAKKARAKKTTARKK